MKKKWIVIPSLLVLAVVGAAVLFKPPGRPLLPQPKVVVDRAMRTEAIDNLVKDLNEHYVFPEKAKQMEAVLRQRQAEGKYDAITDGEQFAQQLQDDLLGVTHDLHMGVEFDPGKVPDFDAGGPPPETQAEWEKRTNFANRMIVRIRMRMMNYGVDKVDHLKPNIGYVKVSGFPPPFVVADKYAETMDKLADTDGLILDLRENHGGTPTSVALLVSYFVDQRTRLNDIWDRDTGASKEFWTDDKLDGKRYGGKKPVIILAGPGTASAGEDFTYTMQAMKRATVIGGRTWGGAHPTRPFRLGDHFYAVIPNARSINPITHSNWEGTGVIPDLAVAPDAALEAGTNLLQRQIKAASLRTAAAR
jgi:retinol-binding protein 3